MKITAYTEKGSYHGTNEDGLLLDRTVFTSGTHRLDGAPALLAVADGLGGCPYGDVATAFVLSSLAEAQDVTPASLTAINEALLCHAAACYGGAPMATAVTGLFLRGERAVLFHVGNTRLSELRHGAYLIPITEDDSLVNYRYQRGEITREEMKTHPERHKICAFFGGGDDGFFQVKVRTVLLPDTFILTSDGIHDHIDVDTLEALLSEMSDREACAKSIVAAARRAGSRDDATVIICDRGET